MSPEECYRHAGMVAKRRCYQCGRPICRSCQVPLDHHLFCGEECHAVWLALPPPVKPKKEKAVRAEEAARALSQEMQALAEKLSGMDQRLADLAQKIPRLDELGDRLERLETEQKELRVERSKSSAVPADRQGREMEQFRSRLQGLESAEQGWRQAEEKARAAVPRMRRRSYLMLVVGILFGITAGGLATARVKQWSQTRPEKTARPAHLSGDSVFAAPNLDYDRWSPPLAPPTLDLNPTRMTLKQAEATFTGYAPGAVKITLFVNNQERARVEAKNLGFIFDRVALETGLNVIQVRSEDRFGNTAFSLAHLIDRLNEVEAVVQLPRGSDFKRGARNKPFLVLTIDAGSANRRADKILDLLHEKRLTTTFFLTGRFIERYPEIVLRIVAEGHEAGNHTYDHPHLTTFTANGHNYTSPGWTRERFQEELSRTRKLFEDLTGAKMAPWWRAPYGEHNQEVREWAEEIGFRHVDWTRSPKNLDMLDWIADEHDRHYLNAAGLYRRLVGIDDGVPGAANGAIILTHLGSDRKQDFMDQVLGKAIDTLRGRGYQFVTVSRMFGQ